MLVIVLFESLSTGLEVLKFVFVKDPEIATHQAEDPYFIRCSLRDPSDNI